MVAHTWWEKETGGLERGVKLPIEETEDFPKNTTVVPLSVLLEVQSQGNTLPGLREQCLTGAQIILTTNK